MVALPFSDNIVAVSSILVALTVLMYYLSRFTEIKGNVGYAYTVYPWVSTFPETLVSIITAVFGYPITAIWNSVFSATFDAAVVFGVSGIGKRVVFRPVKLVIPTVVGGFVFASLLAVDFSVGVFDGFILYIYLIAVTAIAISLYGFRIDVRKENLVKHILGLFAIVVAAVVFSFYVVALANLINQKIAGVVAACLTSIPDLVVAAVYGIDSEVSQAEILGCITHDFAENMATAAIVAGLFGVEIVDANPLLTAMVVAMTMVVLIATTIDGDIDSYDALLLIGSFFILAFFAIMM
jgi:Ca2+/Na+ antiporter